MTYACGGLNCNLSGCKCDPESSLFLFSLEQTGSATSPDYGCKRSLVGCSFGSRIAIPRREWAGRSKGIGAVSGEIRGKSNLAVSFLLSCASFKSLTSSYLTLSQSLYIYPVLDYLRTTYPNLARTTYTYTYIKIKSIKMVKITSAFVGAAAVAAVSAQSYVLSHCVPRDEA
jgi:hypothetical protein